MTKVVAARIIINAAAMAPVIPGPYVNYRLGIIAWAVVTVRIVSWVTVVVVSAPERETQSDPD